MQWFVDVANLYSDCDYWNANDMNNALVVDALNVLEGINTWNLYRQWAGSRNEHVLEFITPAGTYGVN